MNPILVVENLSKVYSESHHLHKSYAIADLFREIFRMGPRKDDELRKDEFWAVKDASFSLYPGESLALIGKNGSGKSTLLKMLHGVTRPDEGKIIVNGSVQALINLGAGFDKRLTGRENIYYSAALAGMSLSDAERIYEPIMAFADLGSFIDSAVSTYSSGMYARLGFAVATHLDPDIILIDEILAVGDVSFQNKCFAKMHELKTRGVTMILVSHSHARVSQFCDRAIWLNEGSIMEVGDVKPVLKSYLNFMGSGESVGIRKATDLHSQLGSKETKSALFGAIYDELNDVNDISMSVRQDGISVDRVIVNTPVEIEYSFRLRREVTDLNVSINVYREDGVLMTTISTLNGDLVKHIKNGLVTCKIEIPDFNINPGKYMIVLPIHEGHSYLYRDVVSVLRVAPGNQYTWGAINLNCKYTVGSDLP